MDLSKLEVAVAALLAVEDVSDDSIPQMMACGCDKCQIMLTIYGEMREKMNGLLGMKTDAAIN